MPSHAATATASSGGSGTGALGHRVVLSPRVRRTLWVLLLAITVLAVLAIGVFPTRQYLAQRSATAERQTTLEQLRAENANLQSRVDALSTDAEIERIARSEYNLVRPGEESYAILPPPATGPRVPAIWPFTD
jgi:cell division protein FtsL